MSTLAFVAAHRSRLQRLWVVGLALYLALIALLSLMPPPELPLDPGRFDKLWHGLGYAVAGLACVPLLRRPSGFVAAALGLSAFGLALEFLQGAGGVRSFDLMDGLANGLGAGLGLLAGVSPLRGLLAASR
ncbi:MAG: VanZ family protein [Xanthomonadales bacterium]|nr:VanZ family protein [Xanthomonadales bacterium]